MTPAQTPSKAEPTGGVARSRAAIYSLLAQSLYAPSAELCAAVEYGTFRDLLDGALAGTHRRHRRAIPPASIERFAFKDDGEPFLRCMGIEYTKLFALNLLCPQYEADYLSNDPDDSAHVISDVAGLYATLGMELAEGVTERHDHIAVELAFMNYLCFREIYATDHRQPEKVRLWRRAQGVFLKKHLLRWAPRFCLILRSASSFWFYQAVECLLNGFLQGEARYLKVGVHGLYESPGARSNERGCGSDRPPASELVTISGLTQAAG